MATAEAFQHVASPNTNST